MSGKFSLPKAKKTVDLEQEVLSFWKKHEIFEKSVEQRSEDNVYVFYDGPPFISGLPHYGHLLGSVAKDLIPRYWAMRGKRVERVWGWDAHGLTVENKVQKKLGIKHRKEIEDYGLEKFIEACYEYTAETSAEWPWYVDRIGRWVDMENAYKTTDQSYMESVIWAFKELYDKDLIYKGVRTSLYCTVCGTPVSNFEVAMDNAYKEAQDPAIVVKFELSEGDYKDAFVLAWTTTPWTVPSNRALVLDPQADYVLAVSEGSKYILAKSRVEAIFGDKDYSVEDTFKGEKLLGLSYTPPYTFFKSNEKDFKIYAYENMVTMEEGTGIVHSAPGFGDIDTEMGRHYGLTMMLTLNDEGHFNPGDVGTNPFEGDYYKKANKRILEDLQERSLLFSEEVTVHRVPYHDRCDTLLIHRAQPSWFVDVQKLKKKMLSYNEDINWVPDSLKEGRFKHVIETAPDWCISRNRFWATPMPVWESEEGDRIVVGSIAELEELSGEKVENLHRPYIDNVTIERNGKVYKRIPEVLDSWFEAGSMPYAQFHYPFKNKERFEQNFPGDFVVEYIAQVRAWFNVMHRLSTAIFDSPPFKNVICTGVMAGNDGRKMSKTYQNYTDPKDVLETYGGDALRLWLMNSPLMVGENASFEEDEIKTKQKNVLNILWNSLRYFVLYANKFEFKPEDVEELSQDATHPMDLWIKTRLEQTQKIVMENLEKYTVPPAVEAVENFVDDLSRWYIRRSRDRISAGDVKAFSTLYHVLKKFSKVAAPIVPFMTENIYQTLRQKEEPVSVHLCDYPSLDLSFLGENLEMLAHMKSDRLLVSQVLALRDKEGIGIRQPLNDFVTLAEVHFPNIVKEELNVKEITKVSSLEDLSANYVTGENLSVALNIEVTESLRVEGEKRNVIRNLQKERKKAKLGLGDKISATIPQNPLNKKVLEKYSQEIKQSVDAVEITLGSAYAVKKV
ncbi:isoleucine--tRNA ligase [candidate division WWE3 bacterium]|nr:isoleucine--tRNA ligase [candidate division WWE3 bacterium]